MNLNKGISTPIAILIVVILAALVGGVLYWQQSVVPKPPLYEFVSFSELTSNPQKYDNRVITTEGFYIGAFETSVLSPNIEFLEGGLPQSRDPNRIWVGGILEQKVLDQLYSIKDPQKVVYGKIRITGRFNTGGGFGQEGDYKHLLSDIKQVKVLTWSPPKDETADWKVYKNKKYGLELKYPPQLSILHQNNNYVEWHFPERSIPGLTPMRLSIETEGSEPRLHAFVEDKKESIQEIWIGVPEGEKKIAEMRFEGFHNTNTGLEYAKFEVFDFNNGGYFDRIYFATDFAIVSLDSHLDWEGLPTENNPQLFSTIIDSISLVR